MREFWNDYCSICIFSGKKRKPETSVEWQVWNGHVQSIMIVSRRIDTRDIVEIEWIPTEGRVHEHLRNYPRMNWTLKIIERWVYTTQWTVTFSSFFLRSLPLFWPLFLFVFNFKPRFLLIDRQYDAIKVRKRTYEIVMLACISSFVWSWNDEILETKI